MIFLCLLYYSHRTLTTFTVTKCVSGFPHTILNPQFSSITTLSTWKWCQIPQVKGSLPQDWSHPTTDTSHK